jgi:lysophospholipase L1-like esterase
MTTTEPTTDPVAVERTDPHCLPVAAMAQLLAGVPWRRVALVGDSIAAGVGDPVDGYQDASWGERLLAALQAATGPVEHRNLGVRGLLAAEVRAQQLDEALAFGPQLAVVSAGANDMLRRSFDAERVEAELEAIIGPIAATGCLVATFGLLDLSRTSFVPDSMRDGLHDRIAALNAATRAVTARHVGVHVDFFTHPALDDGIFSADMIHPNRKGHAHIATALVRSLAEAHRQRRAAAGLAALVQALGRAHERSRSDAPTRPGPGGPR